MKKLLLPLLCLAGRAGFAQITVDASVHRAFDAASGKLSIIQQEHLGSKKDLKQLPGVAIFTTYSIDTLNKADIKESGNPVYLSAPNGKTLPAVTNQSTGLPIPAAAFIKNDTLELQAPFIPFNDQYIVHKIINQKQLGTYVLYMKHDTVFRLNLADKKSNRLQIPVTVPEFKLSTNGFKPGQTLYGEVEYTTAPYFVDDANFKTGYICKRLHCKYVFRAKVFDAKKPPL